MKFFRLISFILLSASAFSLEPVVVNINNIHQCSELQQVLEDEGVICLSHSSKCKRRSVKVFAEEMIDEVCPTRVSYTLTQKAEKYQASFSDTECDLGYTCERDWYIPHFP